VPVTAAPVSVGWPDVGLSAIAGDHPASPTALVQVTCGPDATRSRGSVFTGR
jgi:hypothetical protein